MTQFLITDIRTLAKTWVPAASVREALIAHDNLGRAVKLPPTSKASHYGSGNFIDTSLGNSLCVGYRADVVRES